MAGQARVKQRRSVLIVVAVVVALIAVVALVRHEQRQAVFAAVPSAPYPADGRHGACRGTDGLAQDVGSRRPWVDARPSGATVLWLPGFNGTPCVSDRTQLDAAQAAILAEAVRHGKSSGRGPRNCPADDGSSATVFFGYPGRADAEVVRFWLRGCSSVSAPDRGSVGYDDAAATVLSNEAPPSFATFG